MHRIVLTIGMTAWEADSTECLHFPYSKAQITNRSLSSCLSDTVKVKGEMLFACGKWRQAGMEAAAAKTVVTLQLVSESWKIQGADAHGLGWGCLRKQPFTYDWLRSQSWPEKTISLETRSDPKTGCHTLLIYCITEEKSHWGIFTVWWQCTMEVDRFTQSGAGLLWCWTGLRSWENPHA